MTSTVSIKKACIIGGGAFGTALSSVLSGSSASVSVWTRSEEQTERVRASRENSDYLPGFPLPDNVHFTANVLEAVDSADIVLIAIPTQFIRSFLIENRSVFPIGVPIVTCAKGIEVDTLLFPYDILLEELPGKYAKFIAALSGPSFAREVMEKQPTSVAVTGDPEIAQLVQKIMSVGTFRVYTTDDTIGCEVAGAVKNVLAIASGAAHGLGFGHNTRALLVCRGLAEISRLAARLGSACKCMCGLAGVGDLMLTCSSEISRNFSVGNRLAKGETLEEIEASTPAVAEGVATAKALHALSRKLQVEMPICEEVYLVLYQGKQVEQALKDLAHRPLSSE